MSALLADPRLQRAAGRALELLGGLAFIGAVAWMLVAGARQPTYNFDLIDYVALAIEWGEDDPEVVHRRTYEALQAELPPAVFADFTSGGTPGPHGPFRERIARDWQAFDANLGFHRGRYLYTLSMYGLHGLGVPLVMAAGLPNKIFWALTGLLALLWAARHLALGPAALLALGILYSPPVLTVVPAFTPDGMAMFVVALALYLWIERRAFRAGAALLALAILVRSDFVLISGGVGVALFALVERTRRPSAPALAGWLVGCAALYLAVAASASDPGWWAAFLGARIRVGDFAELLPFKPRYYWLGMREQLASLHHLGYDLSEDGAFLRGSNFVLTYCAAAAAGIALALRSRCKELDVHAAVLAGLILATAVRYAAFPHLWDRYFVYLWVPVPLCLVALGAALVGRVRAADDVAER